MRVFIGALLLVGACAPDQPADQTQTSHSAVEMPGAAVSVPASASALMAIPEDREALKRLEGMGYTIHADQGHLHAPGVTSCPKMGDDPVM